MNINASKVINIQIMLHRFCIEMQCLYLWFLLQQVQSLKMMVRWLLGLKSNANNSGTSTLRLLHTLMLHEGDLMEHGQIK